jgi:hypothetical protein
MKIAGLFILALIILVACTKKVGTNPDLAYSDFAMLDSINKPLYYYKNNSTIIYPGTSGPHGPHKLRFNSIGFKALVDSGKLPLSKKMPDGSLIVKDVYDGNNAISYYAFMYKLSGSWIWGEIKPNKQVLFSVNQNPSVCIGCHSQTGNRDLVTSFYFH